MGQAHRSLYAVRSLVAEIPLLVNACREWGGGDFEPPLQAAAHTGGRAIAETRKGVHRFMIGVAGKICCYRPLWPGSTWR